MTGDLLECRLAGFEALSLSELQPAADLQTRTDRKYVIEPARVASMLDAVAGSARVLEIDGLRTFRYESVYFDTPELHSYMATARKRARRFKVRTRSYLDSGDCAFEIKLRDHRGRTVKHRRPHAIEDRDCITDDALGFVHSFDALARIAGDLTPTLRTNYRRSTLIVGDSRVTLDTGVTCVRPDCGRGERSGLDGLVVVETKSSGAPCRVDRLLWSMRIRPLALSKYGTGLAALDRRLPANKWHRTLHRHVRVTTPAGEPSVPPAR